ncbi:hypothetical protein [Methanosphaerula palustris]|uniref:hypothetical protein n=1 Tax=Methanosphaerula palustris TaxID=475088 RepID=UPI001F1AC573|nr:hypothetical protein [Methanosphaerula palustris]
MAVSTHTTESQVHFDDRQIQRETTVDLLHLIEQHPLKIRTTSPQSHTTFFFAEALEDHSRSRSTTGKNNGKQV